MADVNLPVNPAEKADTLRTMAQLVELQAIKPESAAKALRKAADEIDRLAGELAKYEQ